MSNQRQATAQRLTGTRQWADVTLNIQRGCEHDCRYCYARYDAVTRFGRCTRAEWNQPIIDAAKVDRGVPKYRGRVMFPSAHDITPGNITESLSILRRLLEAGNEVLIVSKPTLSCVQSMVQTLRPWKKKVLFRFTIGSVSDKVLAFWEPGAPLFAERRKALSCAFFEEFATSISCEPYLDAFPQHVYVACKPYLTESFWIGKLRHWKSRADLAGATDEQIGRYVQPLKAAQSDTFVLALVRELRCEPMIRWKDSILEVIERHNAEDGK